jgi:chorismate dehydratase
MSTHVHPEVSQARRTRILQIGSVSYLNARPLIYRLEQSPDLELSLAVPSRLLKGLQQHLCDVALLPVIDYQRMEGLKLIPAGGIGCDGPTLTVRIFSKTPIEKISSLACDTDSHTSVALARIILAERYKLAPEFVALGHQVQRSDARLLIGDKVICEEPQGFEHQLDLGQAWKEMTDLPFVFAVWMARDGIDLGDLPARLEQSKRHGLANVEQLIARYALPRGWPADVARQYLTGYLKYDIGPRQIRGIERFHKLAARHGVIASPRRLEMYR